MPPLPSADWWPMSSLKPIRSPANCLRCARVWPAPSSRFRIVRHSSATDSPSHCWSCRRTLSADDLREPLLVEPALFLTCSVISSSDFPLTYAGEAVREILTELL